MKKSLVSIFVSMQVNGIATLKPALRSPYMYTGLRKLPRVEVTKLHIKPDTIYENVVHAQLIANMVPKENIPRVRVVSENSASVLKGYNGKPFMPLLKTIYPQQV